MRGVSSSDLEAGRGAATFLWRRAVLGVLAAFVAALALVAGNHGAHAEETAREAFRKALSAEDRKAFDAYIAAQVFHDAALDAYWSHVEKKRAQRRAKRSKGRDFSRSDYVLEQPPVYAGPSLTRRLAAAWSTFQDKFEKRPDAPEPEREKLPTVADFLDSARRHYNFVPDRVSESEFKRRYAQEALALGLTGAQVVRVYALETSGLGTADMQAVNRAGEPISTALGYAQLLAANSVSELYKHGASFVERLRAMASRPRVMADRRARLIEKARALERMVRQARRLPFKWSRHVAFAKTDVGRGLHAVNIDGDIGPWLQVIKLRGLKETAEKDGRSRLSGAEMELMNLAGPGTGLEMMLPLARSTPTTNFFARGGYYRNTIVRGKTAEELLLALDQRMEENLKNSGAVEFTAIFLRLEAERRAER
ncbi:MAG: hypothetical protein AB7E80_16685 [Hyphomicrobiaceae bacterium]